MPDSHILPVTINGIGAVMYVDNGCTSCFIRYERAQLLGMLWYMVDRLNVQLFMWSQVKIFHMYVVKNVPVQIKGGPLFLLNGLVFPKGETPSHVLDIMLDNGTLRKLGVIQSFHRNHSTLYFPSNDLIYASKKEDCPMQYVIKGYLSSPKVATQVIIHMDSGASTLFVSKRCMSLLNRTLPPRHINMLIRNKLWLHTNGLIKLAGNNAHDIVFGYQFLSRNNFILDYKNLKMYLKVNGQYYESKLSAELVALNEGKENK
ncbi:hypothetical protein Pmani_037127 [Petrolisthes manimaculis]|uniref:Uncharacterized protein n=1 Tax=Petrolisthes manimaculis TaxID=1843537 RepID=A0AAE1NJS8_9EUCA|nr:hypothetical protein Pmani_037127 [Petrolisthes manimaculis]